MAKYRRTPRRVHLSMRLFATYSIVLLLCLFVLSPYCQAMKMDGQWYWQEDPVHTEDVPEERVVQEAVAGKGDWKTFRVPGQPPVAKNTQYVWLMTTMPAEPILISLECSIL